MAEAKTVPTDANVDEFLHAATPARRQADGLQLAEIFRDVTGAEPVHVGAVDGRLRELPVRVAEQSAHPRRLAQDRVLTRGRPSSRCTD